MPLVEVRLLEGRTPDVKRRVLESVTNAIRESTGAPLERIRVWIHELPLSHYMAGGETAEERLKKG